MFLTTFAISVRRTSAALVVVGLAAAPALAAFDPASVGGDATPASIQTTVDSFRATLGNPNNGNAAGPLASGRREINWDGGGATGSAASGPTLTAFQNTRGGTFTTAGTGFLQTPVNDAALTDINANYATTFGAFSPVRIFTPTGSNITDATFSVPGSGGATQATVSAFGAVFTDVDLANTTRIELFGVGGASLGSYNVPPGTAASGSFSFLGVSANAGERIARVRITTGNSPLGPNDTPIDNVDVVAMDDFFYAEPIEIPEPAAVVLALAGAIGARMAGLRRRA